MRRIWCVVGFSVLLALTVAGQFFLRAHRPPSAPALAEGVFAALGGFRSIAAEVLWFRADRLQEEGRYVELAQLASALTFMEPHTPEVWGYAAWNLAYNVSVMMPTPEDRWRWVQAGLCLLRDKGLVLNPRESELYRELAWMFELKIGADLDSAAPLYREKWADIVRDVASRDAWHELRMERAKMSEIERQTGFSDWTDAQLSAIYWASEGLPHAHGKERSFLGGIIRQAMAIYAKRH